MKNYKKLLFIPLALFILSTIILSVQYYNHGYIIDKDVSLKGGVSATIYTNQQITIEELSNELKNNFPEADFVIRKLSTIGSKQANGLIIETSDITTEQLREFINTNFPNSDISLQETGTGLGQSFFKEMINAIIFAFLLMGLVVFITFKKIVPSIAVILSAFLDIFATLAIISALGMKLSSAGIAAFLMIIGYSIDTDIMLTTKVIKRKQGTLWERTVKAFKTGVTMTLTTIAALLIAFLITNSIVLKQMFAILLIALVIDLISTWIMNTGLLIWYMKKNENA